MSAIKKISKAKRDNFGSICEAGAKFFEKTSEWMGKNGKYVAAAATVALVAGTSFAMAQLAPGMSFAERFENKALIEQSVFFTSAARKNVASYLGLKLTTGMNKMAGYLHTVADNARQ